MASSVERASHDHDDDDEMRNQEAESFCYAVQLVGSSVLPMSMRTAIELGVFDIIAKTGQGAKLSSSQIAAKIDTKNSEAPMMLDRILRFLVGHSVLDCSIVVAKDDNGDDGPPQFERLYNLNHVSKYFVTDEDGVSLVPMMAMVQDKVFSASWSQLKDAIVEGGIPFNRTHGMGVFEYAGSDPRFNQVFNTSMSTHTTIILKKVLQLYKGFEHLKKLVDVGGGVGMTLNLITSRYPHIKGINYDLPHVIKHAPIYSGVEHVGGDMFASVPRGDAILMKWILHDWGDEHCLKLLKNCYNSIPDTGKVIVVEQILPVTPDTSNSVKVASLMNVAMMVQCAGGKERSREELMALATGAGFSGIRYECCACNFWVMEFFK